MVWPRCFRDTTSSYRVKSLLLVLVCKMVANRFRWNALEAAAVGSALNIAVETPIVWVLLGSDLSIGLLGQWTIYWIFNLTASSGGSFQNHVFGFRGF